MNDLKYLDDAGLELRIQWLAERLIWIAPVGVSGLRGYMVCHRIVNNVDRPSTAVTYLLVTPRNGAKWKHPFRENECTFPTFLDALKAATEAEHLPKGPWAKEEGMRRCPKCFRLDEAMPDQCPDCGTPLRSLK
jgi:hypothetical protein